MTEQRKAFEEWGHSQNQSGNTDRLQRKGDGYVFTTADIMWQAWQASQARILELLDSEEMGLLVAKSFNGCWEYLTPTEKKRCEGYSKLAIEAIKQRINQGE